MKTTLTWDEVQLMLYDLYKASNILREFEVQLSDDHLKNNIRECHLSIQRLITELRSTSIVE